MVGADASVRPPRGDLWFVGKWPEASGQRQEAKVCSIFINIHCRPFIGRLFIFLSKLFKMILSAEINNRPVGKVMCGKGENFKGYTPAYSIFNQ